MSAKRVVVIGSGFAGLSAAAFLSKYGFEVTVLEKHGTPGGRARRFSSHGFTFDMGPSWYWMPDVFERFFNAFGSHPEEHYQLNRLDPSYRIYFGPGDFMDVPAGMEALEALFEQYQPGGARKLRLFIEDAAYKYQVGINKLVYYPSRSVTEFLNLRLLIDVMRLNVFQSISKHVRKYFNHERLLQLVEFPVLFLGATPQNTPALYSLMNYADMALGTWYPENGMNSVVQGMYNVAQDQGATFNFNQEVTSFTFEKNRISGVETAQQTYPVDIVVAGSDYHFTETQLLPSHLQSYSAKYWQTRTMAPSSLIFYLGIDKKLKNLLHHTLCFDEPFDLHAEEIYERPQWPSRPLFYLSIPSVSDEKVAPEGCENMFILVPIAPGLKDSEAVRERYYRAIMGRLEKLTGQKISSHVVYKRSYALKEFSEDYHSFKGNAYGLANTLLQTAILKPGLKSKKVKNLFYTGQLTVPGPGVPPSLISGEVVANEIRKEYK